MEVGNGLASVRTVIDDRAESGLVDPELAGDFARGEQQVSENFLIGLAGLADTGDGLARDDENVGWCLGGDVLERTADFIAVNDIRRDLSIVDFFKKRFHVGCRIAAKADSASSWKL